MNDFVIDGEIDCMLCEDCVVVTTQPGHVVLSKENVEAISAWLSEASKTLSERAASSAGGAQ